MSDKQQEEKPFHQTDNNQDETNTNSTVRTLSRRFERQRRPPDKYTITISH